MVGVCVGVVARRLRGTHEAGTHWLRPGGFAGMAPGMQHQMCVLTCSSHMSCAVACTLHSKSPQSVLKCCAQLFIQAHAYGRYACNLHTSVPKVQRPPATLRPASTPHLPLGAVGVGAAVPGRDHVHGAVLARGGCQAISDVGHAIAVAQAVGGPPHLCEGVVV